MRRCGILCLLGFGSRIIGLVWSRRFIRFHWPRIFRWCLAFPGRPKLLLSPTYREALAHKAIRREPTASLLAPLHKNQGRWCSALAVNSHRLETVRVWQRFWCLPCWKERGRTSQDFWRTIQLRNRQYGRRRYLRGRRTLIRMNGHALRMRNQGRRRLLRWLVWRLHLLCVPGSFAIRLSWVLGRVESICPWGRRACRTTDGTRCTIVLWSSWVDRKQL